MSRSGLKGRDSFGELECDRHGFALAAALLAILVVAAIMLAVFYASTEATRTVAAFARSEGALVRAESAVEAAVRDMPRLALDSAPIGGTTTLKPDGGDAPLVVYITRLDSALFSIVGDAGDESLQVGVERRIGVVVRLSVNENGSIAVDRISGQAWSELF